MRVVGLTSTACDSNDDGAPVISMGARLSDYFDSLPSGVVPAIDFDSMGSGFDPVNPMIAYYPNGDILSVDGVPYVVTDNADGDNRYGVPFVNGQAQGYQGGKSGSYTLVSFGEGQHRSTFVADWSGGVSDSGSSSSVSGGSSSSSVVPVGGGSGGSTSGGSTVFDVPSSRPVVNDDGDTYYVIEAPASTAVLPSGDTIVLHDYTALLNALGLNVSSGFSKVHDDLSVVNENLRKQLELDTVVDVAAEQEPEFDTSSVSSEVQSQLDLIEDAQSGWRFDFGMGSNPVGDVITGLIGNPPTSFGSSDHVCDIDFDLPLAGTIHYSFVLSDWFPSAFRSCVLMILSIFFAIACAKAISGAFQ